MVGVAVVVLVVEATGIQVAVEVGVAEVIELEEAGGEVREGVLVLRGERISEQGEMRSLMP